MEIQLEQMQRNKLGLMEWIGPNVLLGHMVHFAFVIILVIVDKWETGRRKALLSTMEFLG